MSLLQVLSLIFKVSHLFSALGLGAGTILHILQRTLAVFLQLHFLLLILNRFLLKLIAFSTQLFQQFSWLAQKLMLLLFLWSFVIQILLTWGLRKTVFDSLTKCRLLVANDVLVPRQGFIRLRHSMQRLGRGTYLLSRHVTVMVLGFLRVVRVARGPRRWRNPWLVFFTTNSRLLLSRFQLR